MSVDRKNGPQINKIASLNIPDVEKKKLSNGTEIFFVNMGTQNLIQVEVLYKGGRLLEQKKGVSRAVARLLKEGTKSYTGAQIAESIDFYGANIGSGASLDYSYAKIFVLSKYFKKVLPIFEEVLFHPSFPAEELEKYKKNCIEKLKVESAKSELVAYKSITEKIYGDDHVYGYNSTAEIYNSLTRDDLLQNFSSSFGSSNCTVVVSGKVTKEVRNKVIELFENRPEHIVKLEYTEPVMIEKGFSVNVKTDDQVQSAVKIGRRLFKRNHPDFANMFVLNTILGGYFGSRLMSSLREDKGYTYNIYSSLDMMIYDGYFNVSTEVGNEYVELTKEGIYNEMEKLQNELVTDTELDMVKNYLSGNFLNMIDGPFKVAGMSKVIALNGLTFDFYGNLMKNIHTVTPEELMNVAKKYLNKEDMVEIVVGNFDSGTN